MCTGQANHQLFTFVCLIFEFVLRWIHTPIKVIAKHRVNDFLVRVDQVEVSKFQFVDVNHMDEKSKHFARFLNPSKEHFFRNYVNFNEDLSHQLTTGD